ncbi:hypothetical protein E7Y31_03485 [Candidatus Frankia alpina]|uniref:DUF7507 domain-containing protein n=1 Tax=Candidatus Frankia alpina TaxID=2699483 RepID=A0A4S5EU08_9ACTN|nr:hypothetical protein E7Y31_03485 [Candidatus Frankia alpina]
MNVAVSGNYTWTVPNVSWQGNVVTRTLDEGSAAGANGGEIHYAPFSNLVTCQSGTPTPSISLTKSVAQTSFTGAGQPLNYSYLVTNSGNTTLTGVAVADALAGVVVNHATASGTTPTGTPVTSTPFTTTTRLVRNPAGPGFPFIIFPFRPPDGFDRPFDHRPDDDSPVTGVGVAGVGVVGSRRGRSPDGPACPPAQRRAGRQAHGWPTARRHGPATTPAGVPARRGRAPARGPRGAGRARCRRRSRRRRAAGRSTTSTPAAAGAGRWPRTAGRCARR